MRRSRKAKEPRGEPTGVVLRGGYVIASWGEPDRVDMTHSVTKSLLSAVVGAGLYCGAHFAAKAWPLTINVTTKREGGR